MATSTAQAIATVPVWDYLLPPGDPSAANPVALKGKKVKITLTYSLAQSSAPVTLLGTDPVNLLTDGNGFFQANLVPNNKISPSGTLYQIELEGYRAYLIKVTDVAVPAIGWQSSAIAVLPPVGGGAPGYTLPGGTTVLGDLTINGVLTVVSATGMQVDANGNISGRSLTISVASPYVPLAGLPAGAFSGKVLDLGGFAYNIKNPGLGAVVLDDGSDQVANINTALGNVPANTTVYWPASAVSYGIGGTITGVKANQTLCGAGRFGSVVQRRNTTNVKMFALETLSGVTIEDLGFDANGANQSSNQECLRFGGNSNNCTVERCNFINVQALALMYFGGPTVRALNPRSWDLDITPIAGTAADLLTMVAEGGSTLGVRIHSGHTAACINIYEANNHPCIGATETLAGLGAIGIACSSTNRCPVIGATITLGANDVGISILKETDNANARPQLNQICSGCTITGLVSSSIGYKLTSASNTHIVGGSLDTLQQGIQYNGGAGLCGVTVGDCEFFNVLDVTLGTAPPFTWWHHNVGVNPLGNLSPPAIPAASVDVVNNFGVGAWVQPSTASTTWSLGFQAPPILYLSTTTTGGTLVPGTYAYRVSMVDQQGGETLACTEVTIVVPAGTNTNTVTVNWYQQGMGYRAGAQSSFRVYGRTSGAELRMATALVNTNSWTDTGSVTPAGALPTVNGSVRSLGTTAGPFPVPANQTVQFTGAAPAAWVWTAIE